MKSKIGQQSLIYPLPVTIVGALVNGRANFNLIAHTGTLNDSPPQMISIAMGKSRFTNNGIRDNKTFSVNILSQKQIVEADYVGSVSGKDVDKSNVFEVYYGDLKTAPMINNCPLSMECRLVDIYDTKTHDIFIGEVVNSYADETVLQDGKVDIAKVDPLFFDMSSLHYWSLGPVAGKCWTEGKKFNK